MHQLITNQLMTVSQLNTNQLTITHRLIRQQLLCIG